MIDYETLCQHISDWRAGNKPGLPPPLPGGVEAAPAYEEAQPVYEEQPASSEGYEEALPVYDEYEELQPDAELEVSDAESEQTQSELPAADYEELDTTLEESGGADEFAESPVDRTAAYVPEDYDPANVAAHIAAQTPELEPLDEELALEDVTSMISHPTPDVSAMEAMPDLAEMPEMPDMPDVSVEDMVASDEDDGEDVDVDTDDDDDDFERDYDLEEIDDFATFDPYTDLKAFFRAELLISAAWEDDEERRAALAQYGIRDEQHFYQVTSTMERYFMSDDADTRYGGLDGIMQLKLDATNDQTREQHEARVEGELASEFEPVHGISLQQWAVAQAHIAQGGDAAEVVAELGLDDATWQAVSAAWNDRMATDTTATIATEYGKAFAAGGAGQFAAAGQAGADAMATGGDPEGDPPIAIEQWVEIEVAQSVGYEQGQDASEILAGFGLTPADWGMAGAWWGQYFAKHAMENDGALHKHYSQLREHYEAHYRGGTEGTEEE